jgi:hypothetical protein
MIEFGIYDDPGRAATDAAALRAAASPLGIEIPPDPDANSDDNYADFGPTTIGISDEEGWERGGVAADRTNASDGGPADGPIPEADTAPLAAEETPPREPVAGDSGNTGTPPPGDTPAEVPAVPEAGETQDTSEPRPQDVVRVKVVPTDHHRDNAVAIAAAVEDCQTVVFELAGGTPEVRAEVETLANTLHSDPDPSNRAAADIILNAVNADYIAATINRLPQTVERIRLADIGDDHPSMAAAQQINRLRGEWSDATHSTTYNDAPGGAREKAEEFVRHSAVTSLEREPVMAEQIADIAADIAATTDATPDNPHTIGFVPGRAHGGTATRIKADGFDVSVTPALPTSPYDGTPVGTTYASIVSDLVAAGDPNAPIDPARLDRATVELAYESAGRPRRTAMALATGMTDAEVSRVINHADFLRAFIQNPRALQIALLGMLRNTETTVAERLRRQAKGA